MKVILNTLFSLFLALNTLAYAMDEDQLQDPSRSPKVFAMQMVKDIQAIQIKKKSPLNKSFTDTQEASYTKANFLVIGSLVQEIRSGADDVINKFTKEIEAVLEDSGYSLSQNWTVEYFPHDTGKPVCASLADPL